ncbi:MULTISPECIES: hypothetical protein [Pseudomonas]|jgi:hypothetical protein|uniref:Uncharacterized protein n=1 Tax=Pseudomonas putida TaxID=303 RepID=A0A6B7PWS8_PSEPU|nr:MULTISPECIES: hypothetical protein [Pseudomonas]MBA1204707.1 hypothetical protein [Pseudomonas capeferrum]QFX76676.1 hypothetical protein [Pseudomonas putida]
MTTLVKVATCLTPELARTIVKMACIVRISQTGEGVEIRDTRPLLDRLESPIEGRGVVRTFGSTHFVVTEDLAHRLDAKHLPGEPTETSPVTAAEDSDALKTIIADRLGSQGWVIVDDLSFNCTSGVAKKQYQTAVGIKEAIAYLQAGDDGARRLLAEYYSEGNNVLSTTTATFTPVCSTEAVGAGTSRFAARVDDVVSGTYAVRLLRPRDLAADGK